STIYDPATSPRVLFAGNKVHVDRVDPLAAQVLQHYPSPNAAAANNYILTGVEPDNQDQFDGRVDHVFNEKHRAFVRYSYLRDNDTPVPFLPDGSGNLTSGVTGHAITRGDGLAADYDWPLSPSTLNQARFGYTRRAVNQSSLQNGGISIPGAPASAFPSTLPIFTVTGYQQIGATSGAKLSTSSIRPTRPAHTPSLQPARILPLAPAEMRWLRSCWARRTLSASTYRIRRFRSGPI